MAKNNIIPVFIPFAGCPYKCIYCNQNKITGQNSFPSLEELEKIIEEQISYFINPGPVELAFYGGTFTLLPFDVQKKYLLFIQRYLDKGSIDRVRVSTRPDAIERDQLVELKSMGLSTVEFGIQSIDPEVLRASGRSVDWSKVNQGIEVVKDLGLKMGLQQMIGLPKDSHKKSMATGKWIVDKEADFVRIYPTLVLRETPLEDLYLGGKYQPLSLEGAVHLAADLLDLYEEAEMNVIRVGLPPLENMRDYVAGPHHLQFRELADSLRYGKKLIQLVEKYEIKGQLLIEAEQNIINKLVGPSKIGKKQLEKMGHRIKYKNSNERGKLKIISDKGTILTDISSLPWSETCI